MTAHEIAEIIVASPDYSAAARALQARDPNLPDCSWALRPLLSSIVDGDDSDTLWEALEDLDKWSDGAFPLEYEAAAFEIVGHSPVVFFERYVAGRDFSLSLVEFALRWPRHALNVEIECRDGWQKDVEVLDKSMEALDTAAKAMAEASRTDERVLMLAAKVKEGLERWLLAKESYEQQCSGQSQQ